MKARNNLLAFVIIGALGTLFHFLYEWTGERYILGFIFPVNESTWEHLKLIFYPTIIYSLIEYFAIKNKPTNYISAITLGIFFGKLSIVTLFYLYSGVLGFNVDFLNITIYYIGLIILLAVKHIIVKNKLFSSSVFNIFSFIYLIICALLFALFTYNPPSLGIFIPPII